MSSSDVISCLSGRRSQRFVFLIARLFGSGIFLFVTVRDKLIRQILAGRSDSNIPFEPLCQMLRWLGFHERISGDHHIFGKAGVVEIVNLQPLPSGKAKAYQVKQVRNLIVRYKLLDESDEN
jgi:hypothetical protein